MCFYNYQSFCESSEVRAKIKDTFGSWISAILFILSLTYPLMVAVRCSSQLPATNYLRFT